MDGCVRWQSLQQKCSSERKERMQHTQKTSTHTCSTSEWIAASDALVECGCCMCTHSSDTAKTTTASTHTSHDAHRGRGCMCREEREEQMCVSPEGEKESRVHVQCSI